MSHKLIEAAEASCRKSKVPSFRIGDTVTVAVRILEGEKERLQPYTGVVIGQRGKGMGEMFTVRRIVNNEGVERIFPLHSPSVSGVKVIRTGEVCRAKLYFLRDRVGKKRRLRERRSRVGPEATGTTAPHTGAKAAEPVGAGS